MLRLDETDHGHHLSPSKAMSVGEHALWLASARFWRS